MAPNNKPQEYIIDVSLVIKWFCIQNEKYVDIATNLFNKIKNNEIVVYAPHFLLIELINILYLKKGFAKPEVNKVIQVLLKSGINFVPFSEKQLDILVDMVSQYGTSAYDSIYLFLAKQKKCKLITFDEELLKIISLTTTPDKI